MEVFLTLPDSTLESLHRAPAPAVTVVLPVGAGPFWLQWGRERWSWQNLGRWREALGQKRGTGAAQMKALCHFVFLSQPTAFLPFFHEQKNAHQRGRSLKHLKRPQPPMHRLASTSMMQSRSACYCSSSWRRICQAPLQWPATCSVNPPQP